MNISICSLLGQCCSANRQDIEKKKKRFSASSKGVENEAFVVKSLAFKIFIFILCKIRNFCQMFRKSCFIIFIDVWPLRYQWYTVTFTFLTMLYALL